MTINTAATERTGRPSPADPPRGKRPDRPRSRQWPTAAAAGLLLWLGLEAHAAVITVGSWTPLFSGIDLASGQQAAQIASEIDQQVLCLRIDLTDPDVVLFTTPRCESCSLETLSENTSHFLEANGLQVAVNGGFFKSSIGSTDTPLGTADDVYGLAISLGDLVSEADNRTYSSVFLFTTNNLAFYLPDNWPATNTAGIYTAITGDRPLLTRGVNVNAPTPGDLDPRTALGLSADRRYLFLMTIDGRQPGWSEGADFHDTGEWLERFGASDGINLDGGGSTTLAVADCLGSPLRLNRSSFVASYGRERIIGHNFGVFARPLPAGLADFTLEPGTTTALVTWTTDTPATTQVEYGASAEYGQVTPLETRLTRRHVATLTGLTPASEYYYRAVSVAGGQSFAEACRFSTLAAHVTTRVFDITQSWRYTTNNLDGVAWTEPGYDDRGWLGEGPGLLVVENSNYVAPKNTLLPPGYGQVIPKTYYFRTHFSCAGSTEGVTLTLSNYVDDGAVFHLNGKEVHRLRLPEAPAAVRNATTAAASPCAGTEQSGDAATFCPDVFTLSGDQVAALVSGDNVLAVEVHNRATGNDLVFGCALFQNVPAPIRPRLELDVEEGVVTLFWNAEGCTLEQAHALDGAADWAEVPGPVTRSPHHAIPQQTTFYRLRR